MEVWKLLTVIAGILIFTGTIIFTAFNTFETKDHARESKSDIIKRLDNIEKEIHFMNRFLINKLGNN
jgi:hypothetical protein